MEITSKDANMVIDVYPVKDWDNTLLNNRILKVLSFKGNTQHKMLITRDEFYYQVKQYVDKHKYQITDDSMIPQFHNWRTLSYV